MYNTFFFYCILQLVLLIIITYACIGPPAGRQTCRSNAQYFLRRVLGASIAIVCHKAVWHGPETRMVNLQCAMHIAAVKIRNFFWHCFIDVLLQWVLQHPILMTRLAFIVVILTQPDLAVKKNDRIPCIKFTSCSHQCFFVRVLVLCMCLQHFYWTVSNNKRKCTLKVNSIYKIQRPSIIKLVIVAHLYVVAPLKVQCIWALGPSSVHIFHKGGRWQNQ